MLHQFVAALMQGTSHDLHPAAIAGRTALAYDRAAVMLAVSKEWAAAQTLDKENP